MALYFCNVTANSTGLKMATLNKNVIGEVLNQNVQTDSVVVVLKYVLNILWLLNLDIRIAMLA